MDILRRIAEERIRTAIERGEFDNLQNKGKPLDLREDTSIPEEIRIAYKVLKNAGYVPPEIELKKEIVSLKELIDTIDNDEERLKKIHQLNAKLLRLNTMLKRPIYLEDSLERQE
ncbi:MAG: DUF1992 domain-containing protein [Thermodesulfobacteriota bacterium]|nr:DUF1992 domain-containing protein [Thermodesulfobacteriota bacterium]